jgi:hypothetical protein
VTETHNADFLFFLNFRQTVTDLSTPAIRSWWSQCLVMAAHSCYSWWRWRSDTLGAWHSHKVMTSLIVLLPSKCCCGDFSAISWLCAVDCFTGAIHTSFKSCNSRASVGIVWRGCVPGCKYSILSGAFSLWTETWRVRSRYNSNVLRYKCGDENPSRVFVHSCSCKFQLIQTIFGSDLG